MNNLQITSPVRERESMTVSKHSLAAALAVAWLLNPLSLQAAIPQHERDALIALYNATDGLRGSISSGWMGFPGTECNWQGVSCDGTQSHVIELKLSNYVLLNGNIPPALGDLTELATLDLSYNHLSGNIPSEIGKLTKLINLYLHSNQLSGNIPSALGNLLQLNRLILSTNQLSGSIPPELGNLTQLSALNLSSNRLSGSIPSALGNLNQLTGLDISGNQLSSSMPPELGNLTQLSVLNLSSNRLSGSIPPKLGNLTQLSVLSLSSNRLSGSIPSALGNLNQLTGLDISGNQLSGSIPSTLGNLTQLWVLDLSGDFAGNQFSGSIPPELGNLTRIGSLVLKENQLTGSIPSSLGRLTQLKTLDLSANQLSGSIPAELGNLTRLETLNLSQNQLAGTLPVDLGKLTGLYTLLLGGNQLTGGIPSTLGRLTQLSTLDLSGNQLSSSIPAELGNMKNLSQMDLNGNQLTGSIPSTLGNVSYLISLDLSGNQLSGSIPFEIGRSLVWLSYLNLGCNRLTGSIPPNLGNLKYLRHLSLYGNQLSGLIPPNLMNLEPSQLYIVYNALYTGDSSLKSFLDFKEPRWDTTQTVPPANLSGMPPSTSAILISWTPISFQNGAGKYEIWIGIASGGPYTLYQSTGSKTDSSLVLNGLDPGRIYNFVMRSVTDPHLFNPNMVVSEFSAQISVVAGMNPSLDRIVSSGGAGIATTLANQGAIQTGYVKVKVNSGYAPYGTAVFSYKQNGVTVSEAGVPASAPTTSARIFIDFRSAVPAVPGRTDAGTIDINTGIAIVNCGSAIANITYTLRGVTGVTLSSGHGTLSAGWHFAKFINQMTEVAPDFSLPTSFPTAIGFASLEVSSDQLLSILALRMTTNQRSEALFTTTPTADLLKPLNSIAAHFPHFADGGGYTTALFLLNTSDAVETGTLQILDDKGLPLVVNQVGSIAGSLFKYNIPPGGAFHFQSDGIPTTTKAGWVKLTPDFSSSTPIGSGLFSYNPGNVLISETGIPASASTTHARIFVDLSGRHNTGLAVANPSDTNASITLRAFQNDGITEVGTNKGPLQLLANGHGAAFAGELIAELPDEFQGVLDISSKTPFSALTLRSLYNERNNFLMTTLPIADPSQPAPAPIVFPHIADGGGYITQFILLSGRGTSSTTLSFYSPTGAPLAIGK